MAASSSNEAQQLQFFLIFLQLAQKCFNWANVFSIKCLHSIKKRQSNYWMSSLWISRSWNTLGLDATFPLELFICDFKLEETTKGTNHHIILCPPRTTDFPIVEFSYEISAIPVLVNMTILPWINCHSKFRSTILPLKKLSNFPLFFISHWTFCKLYSKSQSWEMVISLGTYGIQLPQRQPIC